MGPSCNNHPSSEELSAVEVNSRIHKVFDLGADLNSGASPAPLQGGVASAWVSMLCPISVAYVILSFRHTRGLAQELEGGRSEPWDVNLPEDVAKQEAKHAFNEKMRAQREKENMPRAVPTGRWRGWGVHTPPGFGSSDEEEEEGEITLPPLSSLHKTPPPLGT
jgi:hypothetical protein